MECGNGYEYDWQEEVFQKITSMKEMHFLDLNDIHQRVEVKLMHEEALPQHLRLDQFDKLKQFKNVLERMMRFLTVSKTDIMPSLVDKVDYYEMQMIHFLDMHKPRLVPRQPVQLLQSQSLNNQMQSMSLQDSAPRMLQTQSSSMPASTMELDQENGNGSDWHEDVFQRINSMKEMYLPDLIEIHRRVEVKLQQQEQLRPDEFDKVKHFKTMMERMMRFLSVPKTGIMPTLKDKMDYYEQQIINFLDVHRPRVARQQS